MLGVLQLFKIWYCQDNLSNEIPQYKTERHKGHQYEEKLSLHQQSYWDNSSMTGGMKGTLMLNACLILLPLFCVISWKYSFHRLKGQRFNSPPLQCVRVLLLTALELRDVLDVFWRIRILVSSFIITLNTSCSTPRIQPLMSQGCIGRAKMPINFGLIQPTSNNWKSRFPYYTRQKIGSVSK